MTLLLSLIAVAALAAIARADDTKGLLDEIERAVPASAPAAPRPGAHAAAAGTWSLVRFFAPTLACATAIGVCGGVLGTFVVRRGEALVALTLPQAVAVGAAVGMRLGWPELPPALVAVGVAIAVMVRERRPRAGVPRGAAVVPAMYVSLLCVSFLVIAHGGQHVEALQNLFTGIDVAVTPAEAAVVTPLLVACGAAAAALWRRWLVLAQLPTAARLAGVPVARWDGGFLAIVALYVLLGTATQGVVLVLAMLFLPAAVAGPWARRLPAAMAVAAAVAVGMVVVAFGVSNAIAWPLSHTVGGTGLALLIASRTLRRGAA